MHRVILGLVQADRPALDKVANTSGYNSYMACNWCVMNGESAVGYAKAGGYMRGYSKPTKVEKQKVCLLHVYIRHLCMFTMSLYLCRLTFGRTLSLFYLDVIT